VTTPFICVFAALVLVYASHLPGMYARAKDKKGYDNKQPRRQQRRLKGWGARAVAGHQNALETFPLFASAVIINHLADGDLRTASLLAIAYVIARALYHVAYLADADYIRTLFWLIGFITTCVLFVEPWLGGAAATAVVP